eukprot:Rhum_TRINITY_DN14150_c2_g2::Rhum_TRINITY_DN14150_c2_g2_i1::g.70177::m.70177
MRCPVGSAPLGRGRRSRTEGPHTQKKVRAPSAATGRTHAVVVAVASPRRGSVDSAASRGAPRSVWAGGSPPRPSHSHLPQAARRHWCVECAGCARSEGGCRASGEASRDAVSGPTAAPPAWRARPGASRLAHRKLCFIHVESLLVGARARRRPNPPGRRCGRRVPLPRLSRGVLEVVDGQTGKPEARVAAPQRKGKAVAGPQIKERCDARWAARRSAEDGVQEQKAHTLRKKCVRRAPPQVAHTPSSSPSQARAADRLILPHPEARPEASGLAARHLVLHTRTSRRRRAGIGVWSAPVVLGARADVGPAGRPAETLSAARRPHRRPGARGQAPRASRTGSCASFMSSLCSSVRARGA